VNKVRGKTILWMSLIAMLFSVMMANVGFSAPPTPLPEIYMEPVGRVPGPGGLGQPDDIIPVSVYISNAVNLWSAQFTIKYAPFYAVLVPQDFTAGPFLTEGVEGDDWKMEVVTSGLEGSVTFVILRMAEWWEPHIPVSGSGLLATFNFLVKEGGESPIELVDSILLELIENPYPPPTYLYDGAEIEHTRAGEAYYYGTTGRLLRVNLPDGRKITAGDTFDICAKVKNEGNIPIYLQVVFEIHRFDDGRNIEIRAGQTYGGGGLGEPLPFEYFYVDGYRENPLIGGHEWYNEGDSMVGEPDGNYMYANSAYAWSMFYSFEDVTLAGREIQNVDLQGYTSQPDGSQDWDFDPYVFPWGAWCDSMGGTVGWSWTGGRYYSGGPYDMPEYYINGAIHTEEAFNSAEVFIENYCPSGPEQRIDAMRWKVEYASITPVVYEIYTVMPGVEVELPCITWPSTLEQVGSYELTATIEYSALEDPTFRHYNSMGSTQKTLSFWIVP
jgi:hypothetical protein